tara:strand:+ start:7155 stop:7331 length:177 start_codon:yes stop_codon:yes gene_type:complete
MLEMVAAIFLVIILSIILLLRVVEVVELLIGLGVEVQEVIETPMDQKPLAEVALQKPH